MILTDEQFSEKKSELDSLARSIDLWQATPMSKLKSEKIAFLFTELQDQMYEIECQFLELKLSKYREIYELIKKP